MSTSTSHAVKVASCATREQAELIKGLLESQGVKAMIDADEYWGITLMTSGGVRVMVLEEQEAYAKEVLRKRSGEERRPALREEGWSYSTYFHI